MAIETPERAAAYASGARYRATDKYRKTLAARNKRPEVKARLAEATAKWYRSKHGRAKMLWHSAKKRAAVKGLDFSLTEAWILERITAGACEVTGLPFELRTDWDRTQKNMPMSPSVDRIDNTRGYTQDNCRVILWALNMALGPYGEVLYAKIAAAYFARKGN